MTSPLQRAVEVMDRLRSPGGCPWDVAQTHESLTRYLLEESYEVIEAIETGDRALLREELGDLLLQVLFHARITQELPPAQAFGIDEVAGDLVDKLVRRHPHVFAGTEAGSADQLNEAWEQQKIREKGRTSAVDGVPIDQPALSLAAKLVSRARRAGIEADAQAAAQPAAEAQPAVDAQANAQPEAQPAAAAAGDIGARLFAVVTEAVEAGVDPEAALRRAARAYRAAIMARETAQETARETAGKPAERKSPSQ
jgi:XTP/dITP diphosphohydrolase